MTDAASRPAPRRGRTLKLATILLVLLGAGLGLLAATQTWYTVHLTAAAGHAAPVAVTGQDAAPALTALSLAGLALALALAIAGRITRIVVGVLGLVLAACLFIAVGGDARSKPGLVADITTVTGVAGHDSVRALIGSLDTAPWPVVALVGAVLLAIGSLAAVVTGRAWPGASRRYDAVRLEPVDGEAAAPTRAKRTPEPRPGDAAVDDWDELSRGDDPTR